MSLSHVTQSCHSVVSLSHVLSVQLCMQLTKAYVAKTLCSQLLLIESVTYVCAMSLSIVMSVSADMSLSIVMLLSTDMSLSIVMPLSIVMSLSTDMSLSITQYCDVTQYCHVSSKLVCLQ